jgi:hypothetical protein
MPHNVAMRADAPYLGLVEPERMRESLCSGYPELPHVARLGFDGVCVTEHSQSCGCR